MKKNDVGAMILAESSRIGKRLFGYEGRKCLNLYDDEGIIGKLYANQNDMQREIDGLIEVVKDLEAKVIALTPKRRAKKATKKAK